MSIYAHRSSVWMKKEVARSLSKKDSFIVNTALQQWLGLQTNVQELNAHRYKGYVRGDNAEGCEKIATKVKNRRDEYLPENVNRPGAAL